MKILLASWDAFCLKDLCDAFHELGHEVTEYPFNRSQGNEDPKYEEELISRLRLHAYDYLFSFNYFPLLSSACQKAGVRYVSWIYDSPYVLLYSCTTANPCNLIFVFDKSMYLEFHRGGISAVHYLPMAANTKRLDAMTDPSVLDEKSKRPCGEVSFVGSLYAENLTLYDKIYPKLKDYTKGYLEGALDAQRNIYGRNFMDEILTPPILEDLQRCAYIGHNADGIETPEYVYSNYVLNRKLTIMERVEYLYRAGLQHSVDLYTPTIDFTLPGVMNHGIVDFYSEAPYVFKLSPVNLNITLRSIKSGIPLRAFDIMGAGGFLLTNYQEDFLDYFVPGEDFACFSSGIDLTDQIDYYLKHPDERNAIAANGHKKVKAAHTFLHRVKEIESYL